ARAEAGGAAAVRVRAAGAAAGSLGCGSSEIGPVRVAGALAAFGAAGAGGAAAGPRAGRGRVPPGLPAHAGATRGVDHAADLLGLGRSTRALPRCDRRR